MLTLTPTEGDDVRGALRTAERSTGLRFAAYLGPAIGPRRHFSERLHAALGTDADRAVLVFVDQRERALEIVTGPLAREWLPDAECRVAATSMAAVLGLGDLVGGLVTGVLLLADRASRRR
ncbi:TPM domain-containing protein [Streptosporangium sp. NPDC002524]|uniref:TPM domain-containing protein n=1 Tax=Streptosporangium sp. NPDC002524 TaxID=3154537 RepID=UPI00332B876E